METESYEAHRRRLLVAQLPSVTLVVCFATLTYLVVVLAIHDHWPIGLVGPLLVELIVPAAALALVRGPLRARPEAAVAATDMLFTAALTAQLLLPYSTTSGVALILCLKMLATALFFPWGPRRQNLSAAASVLLYWLLLVSSPRDLAPVEGVHQVIAPFLAALLSAAGAANADRSRRELHARDRELALSAEDLRLLLASVRESEARKGAILESVLDAIVTTDGDGRILELNPAAERVFGYPRDRALGKHIDDLVPPAEEEGRRTALGASLRERRGILGRRVEWLALRADGSSFPIEMTVTEVKHDGAPMLTVYMRDLTERKRAEDQARQQQAELAHALRVATMGQMAAEMGHEINQPLGAIVNFARGLAARLRRGATDPAAMAKAADHIASEGLRAAEVVRRQRDFLRRGEPQRETAELNAVVRDAAHLVEPDARRHRVAVRLALDASLPPLSIDRIQIEQVVLNLLRNGLEAIVEAGGQRHELTVETCMSNGEAQVTVSDTGGGLPAGGVDEIFTPFYTTKASGLGLGLSIGRSIVEAHGGKMWAASNHDRGATFGFTLPLAESETGTAGEAATG